MGFYKINYLYDKHIKYNKLKLLDIKKINILLIYMYEYKIYFHQLVIT